MEKLNKKKMRKKRKRKKLSKLLPLNMKELIKINQFG